MRGQKKSPNIYSSVAMDVVLSSKENNSFKQCDITKEVKQEIASGSKQKLHDITILK